jgi:hypothetical protein
MLTFRMGSLLQASTMVLVAEAAERVAVTVSLLVAVSGFVLSCGRQLLRTQ